MLPSSCCLSSYFISFVVKTFYFWRFKVNVHVTYSFEFAYPTQKATQWTQPSAPASARRRKTDAKRTQSRRGKDASWTYPRAPADAKSTQIACRQFLGSTVSHTARLSFNYTNSVFERKCYGMADLLSRFNINLFPVAALNIVSICLFYQPILAPLD